MTVWIISECNHLNVGLLRTTKVCKTFLISLKFQKIFVEGKKYKGITIQWTNSSKLFCVATDCPEAEIKRNTDIMIDQKANPAKVTDLLRNTFKDNANFAVSILF